MDDPAALRLKPGCRSHDVHHHKRRHGTSRRWLQELFGSLKHQFASTACRSCIAPVLPYSPGFVASGFAFARRRPRVDRNRFHP
jgi:hypothetical protein